MDPDAVRGRMLVEESREAVVVLDDGTRVTTDANGLFSIRNVLPGYRTAALDLTASPGYALAPSRRFQERNSPTRLIHLAPGGMARVNFAAMLTDDHRPTTSDQRWRMGRRGGATVGASGRQASHSPNGAPLVVGRWSVVVRLSPESAVQPGDETE